MVDDILNLTLTDEDRAAITVDADKLELLGVALSEGFHSSESFSASFTSTVGDFLVSDTPEAAQEKKPKKKRGAGYTTRRVSPRTRRSSSRKSVK